MPVVNLKGFSLLTKMINLNRLKKQTFQELAFVRGSISVVKQQREIRKIVNLHLFSVIVKAKPGALTTHPDVD